MMRPMSVVRGSLPGVGPEISDVLHEVSRRGLGGATFYSLIELSPTLDRGELDAHRVLANDLGVSLGASLDWLNPARPERVADMTTLGSGSLDRGFERLIAAAASLSIHEMYFSIGTLEDRKVGWPEQLAAVADFLRASIPVLRAHGTRLLVKTHEEITSFEVLELLQRVQSEWLGVSFDPVNLLVRLEDPLAAAGRLAPYISQFHLDDAVLKFEGNGIRRYLCPMGDGVIDWSALFALAPAAARLVELHRGQFAMPVFDSVWLAEQDYLDVEGFSSFMGLAAKQLQSPIPDQNDLSLRLERALNKFR